MVGCIVRHLHYMFISEEDLVKRVKKEGLPDWGTFFFWTKLFYSKVIVKEFIENANNKY